MARRLKDTSFENMHKVVDNDVGLDVHGDLDITMAAAYVEDAHNSAAVDEVMEEVEKKSEVVITEHEEPEAPIKNEYTKTLKLDESFEEFEGYEEDELDSVEYKISHYELDIEEALDNIHNQMYTLHDKWESGELLADMYLIILKDMYKVVTSDVINTAIKESINKCVTDQPVLSEGKKRAPKVSDGSNGHVYDLDMLDYISSLFEAITPSPNTTFITGLDGEEVDRFITSRGSKGNSQDDDYEENDAPLQTGVIDDEFTLYGHDPSRFDQAKIICDELKLTYTDVRPDRRSNAYWEYNMGIKIPMEADGETPRRIEDYMSEVYPEEADTVMHKLFRKETLGTDYYKRKIKEAIPGIIDAALGKVGNSELNIPDALDYVYSTIDEMATRHHVVYKPSTKQIIKRFDNEYPIDTEIDYCVEDAIDDHLTDTEALDNLYTYLDDFYGSGYYNRDTVRKKFDRAFSKASKDANKKK